MPKEQVEKIMNNISFSEGKSEGYGIGLSQVRETLYNNQGRLSIDSKLGEGTTITVTFPQISLPAWAVDEIKLTANDIIVIVDDDSSIHGAWNAKLASVLASNPDLTIKHFELGSEAVNFINNLEHANNKFNQSNQFNKDKIMLLTDYELLNQELDGLDIIKQTNITRSILVTSHYMAKEVREEALLTKTKILPKQLASEISITIIKNKAQEQEEKSLVVINTNKFKPVDLIFIDDDEMLLEILTTTLFKDKLVVKYSNPDDFLSEIEYYSKQTRICLDNKFTNSSLTGIQIAKQLYAKGYHNLYILSGKDFSQEAIPDYLTVISKTDLNRVKSLIA